MSIITLKDVNKFYGKREIEVQALNDITLEIEKGEMVAIIGKSGSGKSTLANIIGGLDSPSSGSYFFKDSEVSEFSLSELAKFRRENIGFVIQNFGLIEDMTVFENIELPLKYSKVPKIERRKVVESIMKQMDIYEKEKAYPSQLSGGQSQRVAIARGISCRPTILIADEPTGALDESTGKNILEIFKNLNQRGVTVIIVTHDMDIAKLCNKVIEIRDGSIASIINRE